MFKVLIVDDEPIVRKGIMNIINWKSLGCHVIGESGNGLEGLKLIEKESPDIIITDINMPEIDGLEMIRRTLKMTPNCKIIVLTGYRDFDYIQEALKLGAVEYLLKPSKIEEITTAVRKACLELEYKNRRNETFVMLEEHYKKSLPLLREKLLFDIVFRMTSDQEEIEEEMSLYQLKIHEFMMVSIDIKHSNQIDVYQKQLYKFGIRNAFVDIYSDEYICDAVQVTPSRMAFVLQQLKPSTAFAENVYSKAESFQVLVKSCFDVDMTLGFSTLGQQWQDLYDKMRECEDALAYKLYFGEDALILYEDIQHLNKLHNKQSVYDLKSDIVTANKIGNIHLLEKLNDELYLELEKSQDIDHTLFYINLLKDIKEDFRDDSFIKGQLKEMHQQYVMIADEMVAKSNAKNIKNLSHVLKEALNYIQNNYREAITLQDLADFTYVSTYYLSRMFKKEVGKNFVDYLNEFRVNKAKEYMGDLAYKTYEIAALVGISDPHYFSKIFKKYTGVTPTDYRKGC